MKSLFTFKFPRFIIYVCVLNIIVHSIVTASVKAISPHIVISEIQIAGTVANDEFVELYNTSNQPVDLTGWRLSRRASSVTGSLTTLVSSLSGTIPAHGYFLLANPAFTNLSVSVDQYYSATTSGIAANNTIILFSDNGQTVVDLVGMGTAEQNETASTIVPESGKSIERKASQTSTTLTMQIGGVEELQGNGFDSDNNAENFILRDNPQPQHRLSPQETLNYPTVSPTITSVPTPSPSPSPSPQPTATLTPIPTDAPVSPTPTIEPTPQPTATLTPTIALTPTPGVHIYPFPKGSLVCRWHIRTMQFRFITLSVPLFRCEFMR